MHGAKPGVGSAYTWAYRDGDGDWIDPARTYRLRLPGPIPAKDFWSVVVYDLWTRSMLANGQPFPSLSTYSPASRPTTTGRRRLHRARTAGRQGGELDPHAARTRAGSRSPPLRAAGTMDRRHLEARRPSGGRLMLSVEEAAAFAEEAFVFGMPLVYIACRSRPTPTWRGRPGAGAAESVRALP